MIINKSLADHHIEVFSFEIPRYVINSNQGEFVKLARRLLKNTSFQIQILPPKRAFAAFKKSEHAVIFPFTKGRKNVPALLSDVFYYKKDFLLVRKDNINKAFENSYLCITKGYTYDQEYIQKRKFKVVETTKDQSCLKMLNTNRVDYFLAEGITGAMAIDSLDFKNIVVKEGPITSVPTHFAISNSKEGLIIQKEINKVLRVLKKEDRFKDFFTDDALKLTKKVLGIEYDPLNP